MKIKVKDGLGRRVCTEIKRPDPEAVLVIEEGKEYEVTNEELHTLMLCNYFELKNVEVDNQIAKAVYPDSIVYEPKVQTKATASSVPPPIKAPISPEVVKKG